MIIGLFSRAVLEILSPYLIFSVLIYHFAGKNKHIWYRASCFFLLEISWNVWLKTKFQILLHPPLVGYAFPSGHMHAACAFWGYAAFAYYRQYQQKFWPSVAVIAVGLSGWSLTYNYYHTAFDVFGAVAFAVVELVLYECYLTKWSQAIWVKKFHLPYSLPMLAAAVVLMMLEPGNPVCLFGCGGLFGLFLADILPQRPYQLESVLLIIGSALGFILLAFLKHTFNLNHGVALFASTAVCSLWLAAGMSWLASVFNCSPRLATLLAITPATILVKIRSQLNQ